MPMAFKDLRIILINDRFSLFFSRSLFSYVSHTRTHEQNLNLSQFPGMVLLTALQEWVQCSMKMWSVIQLVCCSG